MRSIKGIMMAVMAQTHGEANDSWSMQPSKNTFIDKLVDKLHGRVLSSIPSSHSSLDKAVLAKPVHLRTSATGNRLKMVQPASFVAASKPVRSCHSAATTAPAGQSSREEAREWIRAWQANQKSEPAQASTSFKTADSFESLFVNLAGVRHHIRDTGEVDPAGPIVVLMHGFAGSTESWEQVAPLLAARGCRAIAIDRVGFGRTERPEVPTLPAPPALPFGEELGQAIESFVKDSDRREGAFGNPLPDPRLALAMGLQRPQALAPRLPWQLSELGEDPYSRSFAISRVLWPLLRDRISPSPTGSRPLYLVGHSAGCPIALRALVDYTSSNFSPLPQGIALAGIALIAPAALDPREDPDAFDDRQFSPQLFEQLPLPANLRLRAEVEARVAAFRAVVSLPDAFGLPTARRMANRDLEEAVLGQMHPRMRSPEFAPLVQDLVVKYSQPVREFPDDWDRGLLNIYRADLTATGNDDLRGRGLLSAALDAKQKVEGLRMLVATGDDDRVVLPRASQRVANLLAADFEEIQEAGHLPMHERPDQIAAILLNFLGCQSH
eukprot:gnl/MRDRNA2_/MRDRNA2_71257_c0_seq2.p1 gnl/MRDRNA2_/MRDRNA2_71257_c0~~gnl/MRDRNA2_/MRDRNA2_71257_c0_seq2.p1  ORF type:complete len:553 (+),score=78.49 gnl/MRDRNA2_/MRDRNA2_71257_c0_seq2:55-1713(+)